MEYRKKLIAVGLVAAIVMAGAGCNKQLIDPETPTTTESVYVDPLSFEGLDNAFRNYNNAINEYMKEHSEECTVIVKDGTTFNGVAANCRYTLSPDGQYEVLQMEKTLENATQVDEYFNLGDGVLIARSTVYNTGDFDPVVKYCITEGCIYQIDTKAETVTKILDLNDASADAKKAELDIYYTFDEIRALYAQ